MAFALNAGNRAFTAARTAPAMRRVGSGPRRICVSVRSAADDAQKAMEEQMKQAMQDPAMQEKLKVSA